MKRNIGNIPVSAKDSFYVVKLVAISKIINRINMEILKIKWNT